MITVGKSAEIAAAKLTASALVDAQAARIIAQGFNYNGNTYQIDANSLSSMTAIFVLLLAGVPNPAGGVWRSTANVNVPMNDTEVKAFILAAKAYVQSVLVASWALKAEVQALTTLHAITAFSPATGWPANL